LDTLEDFARWYEDEVKKNEEERGIPEALRQKMSLVQEILDSKNRMKQREIADGIPCGNMS